VQDKDENAQSCSRRGFLAVAASFPAVRMPGGAAGQAQAGAGSTKLDSGALAQTTIPVSSTAVTRLHGPNPFSPYKKAISLEGNAKNGTGWATHAIDWTGAGSVAWQLESAGGEYALQVCYSSMLKSVPVQVSVADSSFTVSLRPTSGDLPEYNYERVDTDKRIRLKRGINTLKFGIAATNIPAGSLQIRSVELTPVKASKRLAADAAQARARRASTDWMADAVYGLFFHWTSQIAPREGPRRPYKDAVRDFNVEAFADMVAETGAGWVIFTANHAEPHCPAPIRAWEKLFPGQTTERDLIGEMADALNKRHIRLMLYFASHVLGRMGKVDSQQYIEAHKAVLTEVGERYGKRIAGYWFDGWYQTMETYPDVSPAQLYDAVKAGNPERLAAYNFWLFPVESAWQEYWAGEAFGLRPPLGRYIERGAGRGLQLHSAWILDATWTHSKLNTEMEPPRFKDEQLIDYVKACAAKKGTVTFNLGIFQDATIGPATLKQMQALRKAIRGR
jgi:hypothetical protein